MKRIANLFPEIVSFTNLYTAFRKAFKGSRHSREALKFNFYLEKELLQLQQELINKSYQPGAYHHFQIYDPKERTISVAPFSDRVVHHAIVNVLEPLYEKRFIFDSYATRKYKGTHKAIRRAQWFLRQNRWYLKADIEKFFPTVNHQKMMELLERKIKDPHCLWLLERIIINGGENGRGIPIGNLTSQFLANVYLHPLDMFIKQRLSVSHYLRYMDDFVLFSPEKEPLKEWLEEINEYVAGELLLRLKEKSLRLNQRQHGLSFLGARIFPGTIRLRRENLKRVIKKYRHRVFEYQAGQLDEEGLKRSLVSMHGHLNFFDSRSLMDSLIRAGVVQAPTG